MVMIMVDSLVITLTGEIKGGKMYTVLLFLALSLTAHGMEEPPEHPLVITIMQESSSTYEDSQLAERVLDYFLGKNTPKINALLGPLFCEKVKESAMHDEELWETVLQLNLEEKLSDSQEIDKRMRELKKIVSHSIEHMVQEKEGDIFEINMKLKLADKELRAERFKFYGAIVGLGGTLVASIGAIVTILTA